MTSNLLKEQLFGPLYSSSLLSLALDPRIEMPIERALAHLYCVPAPLLIEFITPSTVLAKLKEFSTPEQTLAADDSGSELGFKVDFQRAITLMSPRIYKAYTSYINKKLAWSIKHRLTLTPTTSKLIAKREKAHKVNLLISKLAIK